MRPTTWGPVGARLAHLLMLNPDLDEQYKDIDLRKLMPKERRELLSKIESKILKQP